MATASSIQLVIGLDLYFVRKVRGPPFNGSEEMQYEGVRLMTFKDWPKWGAVWPTVLAKAGFFYTKKDGRPSGLFLLQRSTEDLGSGRLTHG